MLLGSKKIEKDIRERLQSDIRIDRAEIKVSVADGEVTLSGFVPTYLARQAAQMDARAVPNVNAVRNDLLVRHTNELSDEYIGARIKNVLDWSADVDASMINLSVKAGAVFFEGSVKSYWEKIKAEELVSSVEGVVGIDNGLIVIPSLAYEDHVIGENIINALDKNVYIDPHVVKVFVKVESGKIVLSGNVPTWAAYDAILNIAQCTPGVVDVVDRLIVGAISGYNSQIPVQKV